MNQPTATGYAPVNGMEMYWESYGAGDTPLIVVHGGYGAGVLALEELSDQRLVRRLAPRQNSGLGSGRRGVLPWALSDLAPLSRVFGGLLADLVPLGGVLVGLRARLSTLSGVGGRRPAGSGRVLVRALAPGPALRGVLAERHLSLLSALRHRVVSLRGHSCNNRFKVGLAPAITLGNTQLKLRVTRLSLR